MLVKLLDGLIAGETSCYVALLFIIIIYSLLRKILTSTYKKHGGAIRITLGLLIIIYGYYSWVHFDESKMLLNQCWDQFSTKAKEAFNYLFFYEKKVS